MRHGERMTKVATAGVVVALLATLAVPAAALALPGLGRLALGGALRAAGGGGGVSTAAGAGAAVQAAVDARAERLKARIVAVLQARKARFDTASTLVGERITLVGTIADKVAAAGGDVTQVRSDLDQAQQHLSSAKELEAQAVSAFQAIPQQQDKLAAFVQARGIGRQAVNELLQSRIHVLSAVRELRAQVGQLKANAQAGGGAGPASAGGAAAGGGSAQP